MRWLTPEDDSRIEPIWWHSGKQPLDQTIRHIQKARVNVQLYAALVVAASLGIVMAVIFLTINIRFRNQRSAFLWRNVSESIGDGAPMFLY